jgi:hypothetical protein
MLSSIRSVDTEQVSVEEVEEARWEVMLVALVELILDASYYT